MKNKPEALTIDELITIASFLEEEVDRNYDIIDKEHHLGHDDLRWLADIQEILDKVNYQIEHNECN